MKVSPTVYEPMLSVKLMPSATVSPVEVTLLVGLTIEDVPSWLEDVETQPVRANKPSIGTMNLTAFFINELL